MFIVEVCVMTANNAEYLELLRVKNVWEWEVVESFGKFWESPFFPMKTGEKVSFPQLPTPIPKLSTPIRFSP